MMGFGSMKKGAALAAILALSGCASMGLDSLMGGSERVQPSGPQAGTTTGAPDPFVQATADSICPPLEIKTGAEVYTIYARGAENTGAGVRYQATIGQTARECSLLPGTLLINVGLAGRVLMGPRGEPATLDLPVRLVVVSRASGTAILSELRQARAVIEPGQTSAVFTLVENGLAIPAPATREDTVLYVGFDPNGGAPAR